MKLTCEQFEQLMDFYIDNKLKTGLKKLFEGHLMTCKLCRYKFNMFYSIIKDLQKSYKTLCNHNFSETCDCNSSAEMLINKEISAYIDNELDFNKNIKIRKMIMTKEKIREKIKKLYKLKELFNMSFEKTIFKHDYSIPVIKNIFKKKYKQQKTYLMYICLLIPVICLVLMAFIFN